MIEIEIRVLCDTVPAELDGEDGVACVGQENVIVWMDSMVVGESGGGCTSRMAAACFVDEGNRAN